MLKYISRIFKSKFPVRRTEGRFASLNIDDLAVSYGLSVERIGRFLEAELGWVYQVQIVLSPFDFNLDLSEVDKLQEYSGLLLYQNKGGKKRFITSNPDLIMGAGVELEKMKKMGVEFQLANTETLVAILDRIRIIRKVLDVVDEEHRFSYSLFLLSFLDSIDIGAKKIEYSEGSYVAASENDRYEGVVSREVIRVVRGVLIRNYLMPLEILFKEIGILGVLSYELTSYGFILKIGADSNEYVGTRSSELKHILLVDDDQRFVDLLKRGISLKGFRVSVASSARQAIEYLNTSGVKVDLVVSDFHMPNYSGASLISSIREVDKNLPVIGLTGDSQVESHLSFISAGANAIVRKSDDPKVLLAWIYKLLNDELHLRVA